MADNFYIVSNDYLIHYGIPRKSGRYPWGSGDRPYQSSEGGKKSEKKEGYFSKRKRIKNEQRLAKQRNENLKKAREAAAEKKRRAADKERVLREGTATEVLSYVPELTNAELSSALNRVKWTSELASLSEKELSSGWDKIDKVMSKVKKINDWTNTAVSSANTVKNLNSILNSINKSIEDDLKKNKNKQSQNKSKSG